MALSGRLPESPESIVVLRALGLGDLLTGVPALRGLRRRYPEAEIVLATPEPLRDLAMAAAAVDGVLPTAGLGALPSAVRRPDLAVNLHGCGPQSIADLRGLQPRRLLTHFHGRYPEHGGPPWPSDCHEVDRWCVMLAWFGIVCDPLDLAIDVTGTPAHLGVVVIHPGASALSRRWPAHRYATVAAQLHRAGHEVVITGNTGESALAEFVALRAGLPPSAVLAGSLSVLDLVTLVSGAALLICGDTGVAHIATATATPSVLLFGPTSPAHWGPRINGPHQVLWSGRTGDPHGGRPDAGLVEIGTIEVLTATAEALKAYA